MQNTINFNNTKIEDINDTLGKAQHGDLTLVFNKQDNFICCSSLVQLLKPTADIYKFFKLQTTEALVSGSQPEVTELYYKMTKAQSQTNRDYTGYYIHQDLFYAFMLWLCPSKFIQYSRLLNLVLQNFTIENQIQSPETEINLQNIIDKLTKENEKNIITIKNIKYAEVLVRMTGNYYKFLGYELTDIDYFKMQNGETYIYINDKTELGYSYIIQNFYQLQSNQITGSTTVFNQIYNNNNNNPYQQFGSNTLHIFYVQEKNYQARQIDFYNRINQNGPIEIQLYDMDQQKVNLQFIIQIRLFKQSLFHMKANSEVATNKIKQIEQHNKKCIYLFLEKDQQQFILQQQFRYISLVYAYGNQNKDIIQNETEKVCSYVCQLKLNNKDFALLTLNRNEIYNQNNNIFVWNEQTTNTNQLQFEFKIIKTLYDGRRIEVEPDKMNFLLLKLYVKEEEQE
ncbi:Conserved_hypothetical protein [Hexamita inflata]|uniref:KilA-N domain-containing protein n=1 Tax=Hexamita inflata TaxID=28002 RepID=A0ABP1KRA5_9EUKA